MVVMLRGCCFLTQLQFSLNANTNSNPHLPLPGKFACLSFKLDKFVPLFKDTLDGSSEIHTSRFSALMEVSGMMEDTYQRFLSLMFLASNILMFSTPCKALAKTCEADNSVFNMPLLISVALIGATVGGLLARQRRGELKPVNDQLRQINAALRRQAKIESYAPSLSYAPIGGRVLENEVIVDPQKQELISRLKNGKNYLRNQQPDRALMEFKIALKLAQNLNDPIEEKKLLVC